MRRAVGVVLMVLVGCAGDVPPDEQVEIADDILLSDVTTTLFTGPLRATRPRTQVFVEIPELADDVRGIAGSDPRDRLLRDGGLVRVDVSLVDVDGREMLLDRTHRITFNSERFIVAEAAASAASAGKPPHLEFRQVRISGHAAINPGLGLPFRGTGLMV